MRFPLPFCLLWAAGSVLAAPLPDKGTMAVQSLPAAQFTFHGIAGERIEANIDSWLLRAPATNPGMLEMFRLRDRQPAPQSVPWAGEFAGKYLISCVLALRESRRPELKAHTAQFVAELIGTQAEDGYLGPFPKERRLLGEWDLWGHYHVMQGLLAWHDFSSDGAPLTAARRAADLICNTYLSGARRVRDAGSPEMNMAVSHVMAELHRRTGEPRYLTMVREIEKDWEGAGDYLRKGMEGVPFYKTPRPRWESLHDLQALLEMWRITGETRYRDAFVSHWKTIRQFDVRNSGAFSGGEQATGNAFAPTAIETCCTVAWMALSVDALRLLGDASIADELERSTFNGALGAQHPGGRWWTYSTPMDGDRKASAHEIVFQARAGTPELNCCSVNGPRVPGMLADWAVMSDSSGLVINWHGPLEMIATDSQNRPVTLRCESDYPAGGHVVWRIQSAEKMRVRFRIPAWADGTKVSHAGSALTATPGSFLDVEAAWKESEPVTFNFPMNLRFQKGEREQAGKVSLFRGPLLLAWDQRDNPMDEFRIPRIDPAKLECSPVTANNTKSLTGVSPWILLELRTPAGPLRLRDFATAGMSGTRYRSWLRTVGPDSNKKGGPPELRADMKTSPVPESGGLLHSTSFTAAEGCVKLNGADGMLVYSLPEHFGEGDFTAAVSVKADTLPANRIAQVFSAWCAPGDDPLRLVVQNGHLHARIESGGGNAGTGGVPLPAGEWHHVAAVKEGNVLTLFVDGTVRSSVEVPGVLKTRSKTCAVGGNPLYTGGSEFLAASFRRLAVYGRALTDGEIDSLAKESKP
jgi:DUF1680 family protein